MNTLVTSSWSVVVAHDELTEKQALWFSRYQATTKRLHSFRPHPAEPWTVIECDDQETAQNVFCLLQEILGADPLQIVTYGEEI